MEIKKAFITNKTMEVISEKEFIRRGNFEDPMFEDTCVVKDDILYPIKKGLDLSCTGVMNYTGAIRYVAPKTDEEKLEFSASKIVDFDKAETYADIIKLKDQINRSEIARLTTKDNIYVPAISEEDSPALKLAKQVIGAKEIDLDDYKHRTDSNILRLITSKNNTDITLKRLVSLGDAFDFDVTLTINDKKDAVNPIGKEFSTIVTRGGLEDDK